jgi:CBS domain-containing protein
MSTDLKTLGPDNSLAEARALMIERRIRHLPIVADGKLLGIVSHRDVLAAADSQLLDEAEAHRDKERFVALSELMTRDPMTIDERDSLRAAALLMQRHKLGCLPVVRDGVLRGIVTDSDFVAIAIDLLEQMEVSEESQVEESY